MTALNGLKPLHVSYVAEFIQNMSEPAVVMGHEIYEKMVRDEKDAKAEVEQLREAVRQIHALAEKGQDFAASEAIREIREITKGMVE